MLFISVWVEIVCVTPATESWLAKTNNSVKGEELIVVSNYIIMISGAGLDPRRIYVLWPSYLSWNAIETKQNETISLTLVVIMSESGRLCNLTSGISKTRSRLTPCF